MNDHSNSAESPHVSSRELGATLEDKYVQENGSAFFTGMQVLTRLPMTLRQRDEKAGLNTAGYISGYRGSPLGTYDLALWHAKSHLERHHIHFQPGVNEDLAATAVWGTQQVNMLGQARYDGVFGLWYGKSPGVDRTLDVFRHANVAGTSRHGGVLVIAGDDSNAVSSTVTGYSEYNFVSVGMPMLYPATLQEYLDFGVLGIAMSRFSGCWIGFKAVTDIAESSALVDVGIDRVTVQQPDFVIPDEGVNIRWPDDRLVAEKRLMTVKLAAAKAFARANAIDQRVWDGPQARIGLVAAGKAYLDLRQALQDIGVDDRVATRLGIRLQKIGLVWPIDEHGMHAFCSGLECVFVVEEKRGILEDQVSALLFRSGARVQVLGKLDAAGAELLPSYGELSPELVLDALLRAMPDLQALPSVRTRLAIHQSKRETKSTLPVVPARSAFFCSGCPHNSSTKVPEGSLALAGIGCHWLSLFMDRGTETFTHMGGEGANWLGMAPFTERKHVFVNLGDGTYHHSGVLAIRAAIYANANVTYKLLFNDAVAMTGGQMVSETFTPQQVVAQVLAEGVKRAVVVSDDIEKYKSLPGPNGGFPADVELYHRDELESVQLELRETPGVTLLLYDQTCAAEKRRRRKRGKLTDPDVRVYINPAVCEGCGDCSVKSNCISVEPLETPLGRKRQINQSSCNKDISCVNGFCPSFITLEGATPRKTTPKDAVDIHAMVEHLPIPPMPALKQPYEIVIAGIGGTGVITVSALLGMAAKLTGLGVTCLDQTGIAQKNGAVLSHVRIGAEQSDLFGMRVSTAKANLVLGCDLMVAAGPAAVATMVTGRTTVLANTQLAPNAQFVINPIQADFGETALKDTITQSVGVECVIYVEATRIALALFGDAIASNMFMLGFAFQRGLLPVPLTALERAIEINGAAVVANKKALSWGRFAAHDPEGMAHFLPSPPGQFSITRLVESLDKVIKDRRVRLTDYQNTSYAQRYVDLVERARRAEDRLNLPGPSRFAMAVARNGFRLMAYKDEYEVARLYCDPTFQASLEKAFEGPYKISFHLAPPLLARRDAVTGQLKKQRFGFWIFGAFKILARMKGLRGTRLDPFGRTAERRMERALVNEYELLVEELAQSLNADNHSLAVRLVSLAEQARGFGHVKHRNVERMRFDMSDLIGVWRQTRRESPSPKDLFVTT